MNTHSDEQDDAVPAEVSSELSSASDESGAATFSLAPFTLATADNSLCVRFAWIEDRFWHRVAWGDDAVSSEASNADEGAQSVEGDARGDWPPSPPLQQLSQETINGGAVMFGVGAAGKSHWSLSVEGIETQSGPGLKFQWACRHKTEPRFLGTTYEHAGLLDIIAGPDARLRKETDGRTVIEPMNKSSSGTECWSYVIVAPAGQTSRA